MQTLAQTLRRIRYLTPLPFYDVLPNELVFAVLKYMDLPSLLALRHTSRAANLLVTEQFMHYYTHLLQPFIDDIDLFRQRLRATHSIVSGSLALAFMHPNDGWTPNDMDIYVPHSQYQNMLTHLTGSEGYTFHCSQGMHYTEGITIVTQLTKDSRVIELVQSLTETPLQPIPSFWSSALMNFLTADHFISAYPRLTLLRRGLLTPSRLQPPNIPPPSLRFPLQKYRLRGFDHRLFELQWIREHDISATCSQDHSPHCPLTIRWFGDRYCLNVSLPSVIRTSRDLKHDGYPNDITTLWWRGGSRCGDECGGMSWVPPDIITTTFDLVP